MFKHGDIVIGLPSAARYSRTRPNTKWVFETYLSQQRIRVHSLTKPLKVYDVDPMHFKLTKAFTKLNNRIDFDLL